MYFFFFIYLFDSISERRTDDWQRNYRGCLLLLCNAAIISGEPSPVFPAVAENDSLPWRALQVGSLNI